MPPKPGASATAASTSAVAPPATVITASANARAAHWRRATACGRHSLSDMKQTLKRQPRALVAALAFVAIGHDIGVLAAETPPASSTPSPRIALALSGGGARGLAHVGVLKALDEMHIPISCVTGTSMGSIIAGAFAVGRSADEIEHMVLAADWNDLFRDNPPREEIASRRKLDDYKTLFSPEFGVKAGGL